MTPLKGGGLEPRAITLDPAAIVASPARLVPREKAGEPSDSEEPRRSALGRVLAFLRETLRSGG